MEPVYTPEAMRAFDEYATARGTPSIVLMENAGRGATEVLVRELLAGRPSGKRVVLVAGRGNNGGDAFVVARRLLVLGAVPEVFCRIPISGLRGDALTNAEAFAGLGGALTTLDAEGLPRLSEAVASASAVVDGLFGTGLSRDVEGVDRDVLECLLVARDKLLALDLPSGLCARTGRTLGACVRARHTVTFVAEKLGLVTAEGRDAAGRVHVVDIGVPIDPKGLPREARPCAMRVVPSDVALPARRHATHKFREGHVAVVAGSPGKTGAALLAAHGAARAGAGAVTVASFADTVPSLDARVLEAMTFVVEPVESRVAELLRGKSAVVLGPGLGRDARARAVVERVLALAEVPVVLDADGLAPFEGRLDGLRARRSPTFLLPHEGELGRLLGISSEAVVADRFTRVREAALASGAIVALKGACTFIAGAGADRASVEVSLVDAGHAALATAGSGDVLAGIVAAFACVLSPRRAVEAGALVHGLAGAEWAKANGDRGLLAHEIGDRVPEIVRGLVR